MVQRALKLQYGVIEFCDHNIDDLNLDQLTGEEWTQLRQIAEVLKAFEITTKRLEGNAKEGRFGAMWEGLPCVEYLLHHLEEMKVKYTANTFISESVNSAWQKLEQYYVMMDDSDVYAAALMLTPRYKFHYFDRQWRGKFKPWAIKAKKAMNERYQAYCDVVKPTVDRQLAEQSETELNPIDSFLSTAVPIGPAVDELTDYNKHPPVVLPAGVNVIEWWIQQRSTHPRLAQWALDVLSVPAMSAECERVFSRAKLTLTPLRNRMNADIIEAVECLSNWLPRQEKEKKRKRALDDQGGQIRQPVGQQETPKSDTDDEFYY